MNTYKLKLTALSPIHIGTGEDYEPTNFVIDSGRLYGFDEVLFYKSLNSLDQDSFNQKLHNWLMMIDFYKSKTNEAKKISNFDCEVSKKVEERYKKLKNEDGTKNTNQFQIAQTFKNPNTFRAIIPGSSIKGMLDTVLKIYPQKVKENEPRQKLIISDALIIDGGLEIGYSYRRHKIPSKEARSDIPQIVEIIAPYSTFIATIKTDQAFETLKSKMKAYHKERNDSRYAETENSFIARVGKYNGKEYMVDDGKNVLNSYQKPIATHTLYEKEDQPFGWLKFELISDDEYKKSLIEIKKQEAVYHKSLQEKQKDILESIQKSKEEAQKIAFAKEQKKLQEQKEAEEKVKLELERLSLLSPLELKLDELSTQNQSAPKTTLILQNIKNGTLDEFRDEALKLLEKLMKENKEWKEQSTSKNLAKDKEYQKTLEVKKLLEER